MSKSYVAAPYKTLEKLIDDYENFKSMCEDARVIVGYDDWEGKVPVFQAELKRLEQAVKNKVAEMNGPKDANNTLKGNFMKRFAILSVFLITCATMKSAIVLAPEPVETKEQRDTREYELAKHEQDVQMVNDAAERTFNELMRDINEDFARINHLQKCLEDDTKTYYDCTSKEIQ